MRVLPFALAIPASFAVLGCAHAQEPAPAGGAEPSQRIVYELRITNAGTRSQGLRGVLFDSEGRELPEDAAGQIADTPVGRFRYTPCRMLWSVCGYFREGSTVAAYPGPTLDMDEPQVLVWQLSVAGSAGSTRWGARLIDENGADVAAPADGTVVATALGPFRHRSVVLATTAGVGPLPGDWPESRQP